MVPPATAADATLAPNAAQQLLVRLADVLRRTPVFWAGLYLLLAVVAVFAVWVRRDQGIERSAVLALAASAWSYALPLLVLAPSAEFRYLHWSIVASLLAFAFAIHARYGQLGMHAHAQSAQQAR